MFSAPSRPVPNRLIGRTLAAMGIWMLLFTSGLLIETAEHRYQLAPRSVEKQVGVEGMKSIHGHETAPSSDAATISPDAATKPRLAPNTNPSIFASIYSFFVTMFCYTPTNLAWLTIFAGLIGGHASNISINGMSKDELTELHDKNPRRSLFLQEPPISAAIRGFVVYLCVIAGLYLVMDDPFKDPTPGQYIRLAGSISVMAFLVGYDATRLEDWLRIIPAPTKTQTEGDRSILTPANIGALAQAAVEAHENGGAPAREARTTADIPETLEQAEMKSRAAEAEHSELKETDAKVTTIQVADVQIAQVNVSDGDSAR